MKSLSHVQLFVIPLDPCQAPPSMGFSRQEYWGGLPFPSPGDLPNPGIKPGSPALQADSLPSEPPGNPKLAGNSTKFQGLLQFFLMPQKPSMCTLVILCWSHTVSVDALWKVCGAGSFTEAGHHMVCVVRNHSCKYSI